MEQYCGKSVFHGTAIGRIRFFAGTHSVVCQRITETDEEISRYEEAIRQAMDQLNELYQYVQTKIQEKEARIFSAQAVLLEDESYKRFVHRMIREELVSAEYAVSAARDHFAAMFVSMDDEYLCARAEDIRDVSNRLIHILTGQKQEKISEEEPFILAAVSLTPSELFHFDSSKLLAIMTFEGSSVSHTAILAKILGIPALTGIELREDWHGKQAVVDGAGGRLFIEPDDIILEKYYQLQQQEKEKTDTLLKLKGKSDRTKDGKTIALYANIGYVSDVSHVVANDAAGIGLFRSECLYLGRKTCPTEEEQFEVYQAVVRGMHGKKVVIRTLDIGADKQVGYLNLEREENPALGYRAIRICLDQTELFKEQLRAIYRASAFGNVAVMFPMIISVEEVQRAKMLIEEVKEELDAARLKYGHVEVGIMIETPAAVMISDLLAREVDFFSIGTNDLTQYTLAADRQNARLESICSSHHPALLRMIQMTIDNAHKEGCHVGICGELAADLSLTETFIQMGIDELSVAPSMLLPVRKAIRESYFRM